MIMKDSAKLEMLRRSVGPWISQFESDGCQVSDCISEGSQASSISSYVRNCQGVYIRKKQQPIKRKEAKINSLDRKFRYDIRNDGKIKGDPYRTVFIARLVWDDNQNQALVAQMDYNTTEETLLDVFGKYGSINRLRLVKDVKTEKSRGYAFVEFSDESEARSALRETRDKPLVIDGRKVLVDCVRAGVMPSWLPRRLGGGLGQRQKGTQRFAWKLAYFGDPSRIDHDEIYRKQQMWLEHNRRSMNVFS